MKYLLLIAVVGIGLWLLLGRGRRRIEPGKPSPGRTATTPQSMLACAHCGVHLPREDAVLDGAQRPFCCEAHRSAGPRP